MGYIYLAKDKKLYDRLCIIKQVKEPVKSDPDLKKLGEEAHRMAKLSHPNVAMILDHFVEGEYYFLVMERISGKTLSEVFAERRGKLNEEEVVGWAIAMCDVISYIHEEGIIHRDISPDNIMLTDKGAIKFVDFGTLRELRYITTKGTAGMGKYGYTPPEQWQGKPTPQSDIFALGATIYYLLTGSLPLSREYLSGQGPQRQDFSPSFPPIRTKNPDTSPELEAVLQKALQLDASSRYSSAAEFGKVLRNLGKVGVPRRETMEDAKPVLSVDYQRLDFANVKPGSRATRSFTIRNTGTGRLTGSITGTQPWIKVTPRTISLLDGEQKVLVTVDASGLVSGFKGTGGVNIATNGGTAEIAVNISMAMAVEPQRLPAPTKGRKKRLLSLIVGLALLASLVIAFVIILPFGISEGPSKMGGGLPYEDKLAFDDGSNIYIINADGSNIKKLTESSTRAPEYEIFNNFAPVWSPDGTRIAFFSDRDYQERNDLWFSEEIYVMNADGSDQTRVTYGTVWDRHHQAWSPDGMKIAFTSDRDGNLEIYSVDLNTGYEKNLTNDSGADGEASWSPDGRKIVFSRYTNWNDDVWIMNADGNNQRNLTNNSAEDYCPRWSTDGKSIFFCSNRDGTGRIYIMNADGSNQTNLTSDFNGDISLSPDLSLSPDGKKIAFESGPPGTALKADIYVMNANGTKLRNLTNNPDAHNRNPKWSPDSKRIVFSAYHDGQRNIFIVNADGSALQNLTEDHYRGGDNPAWAPEQEK